MGTNHLNEQYPHTELVLVSEHGAFLVPRVKEMGRRDQKIGLRRMDLWKTRQIVRDPSPAEYK